jgi:hypothetical protein
VITTVPQLQCLFLIKIYRIIVRRPLVTVETFAAFRLLLCRLLYFICFSAKECLPG